MRTMLYVQTYATVTSKVILEWVEKYNIDLIVMRSYAHHGVQSMRLGTTIENTLKRTRVPVLIMSTPAEGRPPEKILLPTDGTRGSQNAENMAIWMAGNFDAELVGLYVCCGRENICKCDHGKKVISNLAWKAEQRGIKFSSRIMEGDPADIIITLGKEYDLVVMGAGRKGFLSRVVIGHVCREVATTCSKPVVLVRGRYKR